MTFVWYFTGRVLTYWRTSSDDDFSTTANVLDPPGTGELFGASVSLGERGFLLVGAPLTGSGGRGTSGRAYKYAWSSESNQWEYLTSYVPSEVPADSNWGVAVAMGSDDTCVVGSSNYQNNEGRIVYQQ